MLLLMTFMTLLKNDAVTINLQLMVFAHRTKSVMWLTKVWIWLSMCICGFKK